MILINLSGAMILLNIYYKKIETELMDVLQILRGIKVAVMNVKFYSLEFHVDNSHFFFA